MLWQTLENGIGGIDRAWSALHSMEGKTTKATAQLLCDMHSRFKLKNSRIRWESYDGF